MTTTTPATQSTQSPNTQTYSPEILACATWTAIAEPGDDVANALRAALGPEAALDLVVNHHDADLDELLHAVSTPDKKRTKNRLAKGLERWHKRLSAFHLDQALTTADHHGIRLITPYHDDWPPGLDLLGDNQPAALWVAGHGAGGLLHGGISVVGGRNATQYGMHIAAEFSAEWAAAGLTIFSGAALGIDAAAHHGALSVGGTTVAILACGVDIPYPSSHAALLHRIKENGLVVSEHPPGARPQRHRFLERNRLLAACSGAVVVVEAAYRSGALNTASWAASAGIPLGAVPGPVTSAMSVGAHRVLREFDGTLIGSVEHGLQLAGKWTEEATPHSAERARDVLSEEEFAICDALPARGDASVADIARDAGTSEQTTTAVLYRLEIMGFARSVAVPGEVARWGIAKTT